MSDNLIIKNMNRGIYLGNRSARGRISNNVIMGNATGISAFSQTNVHIGNNLIADSSYAGLSTRDSCQLMIMNNIFHGNTRGLNVIKEIGKQRFQVGTNTFWANDDDAENAGKFGTGIAEDPHFGDSKKGDFTPGAENLQTKKQGLSDPDVFKALWRRWMESVAAAGVVRTDSDWADIARARMKPVPLPSPSDLYPVVHDISDLIAPRADSVGWVLAPASEEGENTNWRQSEKRYSASWIVNTIKQRISPKSWQSAAGSGTVELYGTRLVVNQTAQNHEDIKELLTDLRMGRGQSIRVEARFFWVPAAEDEEFTKLVPNQILRGLGENATWAGIAQEESQKIITKLRNSEQVIALTGPRFVVLEGEGAHIFLPNRKHKLELPLMGEQGKTVEVDFLTGTGLAFDRIVTTNDSRTVVLGLVARTATVLASEPDRVETETAEYETTLPVPDGHTLFLRTSFVRRKAVGVSKQSVFDGRSMFGSQTRREIVEKRIPNSNPRTYWYVMIKPTVVPTPDVKPPLPIRRMDEPVSSVGVE